MIRLYPRFAALALIASFAVTGATLASTGAPAFAADVVVSAPPSARVAYDDLNLRSPAGVKRLEHRVRAAAQHLCVVRGEGALRARLDALACRDAAVAVAAPQVRRAVARAGGTSSLAFGR
jgi:UrcA family protein